MDDVVSMIEGATGDVSAIMHSVSHDDMDAKTVSSHSTVLSGSGAPLEFGNGGDRHSFDTCPVVSSFDTDGD